MIGKWRNVLVSSQTWHIANKNSFAGGRGIEEQVSELENWHITNKNSLSGGDEEGGAGW